MIVLAFSIFQSINRLFLTCFYLIFNGIFIVFRVCHTLLLLNCSYFVLCYLMECNFIFFWPISTSSFVIFNHLCHLEIYLFYEHYINLSSELSFLVTFIDTKSIITLIPDFSDLTLPHSLLA